MHKNILYFLKVALLIVVCPLAGELTGISLSQSAVITNDAETESCTMVQFDLSSLNGTDIEYAAVDLQFVAPADSCEYFEVVLRPIAVSWNENASWSVGLTEVGEGLIEREAVIVPIARKKGYKARVLLTQLTRKWVRGDLTNYGLMITSSDPAEDKGVLASSQLENGANQLQLELHRSE